MHFYHLAVIFIKAVLAEDYYSCVGYGSVFGAADGDLKSDLGTIKELAIFKDTELWQPDSRVAALKSENQFLQFGYVNMANEIKNG
jgi:hypothetical protein